MRIYTQELNIINVSSMEYNSLKIWQLANFLGEYHNRYSATNMIYSPVQTV